MTEERLIQYEGLNNEGEVVIHGQCYAEQLFDVAVDLFAKQIDDLKAGHIGVSDCAVTVEVKTDPIAFRQPESKISIRS